MHEILKSSTKLCFAIIDRCYIQNGGCNDYCQLVNNTGVVCSCKTGYALQDDGLTCTGKFRLYSDTNS